MHISPDRLRELRRVKNWSREKLAQNSKISLRQINRLEKPSTSPRKSRENTLGRLARALDIEVGVLTGELPMPEPSPTKTPGEREPTKMSINLLPASQLAYELIERRYGVNRTTICNLAPLLFTLLAEGSLSWRRKNLAEIHEAADRLESIGRPGGHLSFAFAGQWQRDESADSELESIERNDLFGRDANGATYDLGYSPSRHNPFADYLREFATRIAKPEVVSVDNDTLEEFGALEHFPHYWVCHEDLQRIAGESDSAVVALRLGHARLRDIPDDLWAEDATERRTRWLEEQVPPTPPMSDTDRKFLNSLADENSEAGS